MTDQQIRLSEDLLLTQHLYAVCIFQRWQKRFGSLATAFTGYSARLLALRWARLVLGWLTHAGGGFNYRWGKLSRYVTKDNYNERNNARCTQAKTSGCQNVSHTSSALWRSRLRTAVCVRASHRPGVKAKAAIVNFSTGCTMHTTLHDWWPSLERRTVCLTCCTDCHHWNNSRNFWNLIYLKFYLRIRTVSNCKGLSKQLALPTALYKLSKLTSS